jgi:flagellar basal-body rod protein FlgB
MPVNKLFGGGVALLGRALDLRAQRQGMIQSNIANMETPGYTVQELPFAKVMAKVRSGGGELARTHPGHIAMDPGQAAAILETTGEKRPVDLDEEMVKLSENQLMYQLTAKLVSKRFEGMQYAIDEGGK